MTTNHDVPVEVEAAFDRYDENIRLRNGITVGALLDSISDDHLGDRHASPDELLRVADVGKELLYAALGHRDVTRAVLHEAREHWGPLVDAALQEMFLDESGEPL